MSMWPYALIVWALVIAGEIDRHAEHQARVGAAKISQQVNP